MRWVLIPKSNQPEILQNHNIRTNIYKRQMYICANLKLSPDWIFSNGNNLMLRIESGQEETKISMMPKYMPIDKIPHTIKKKS